MTLRQRLAVTTLAVGLPLVGGMAWFHGYARERAAEEAFAQLAVLHMQNGGRERCEGAPHMWVEGPLHLSGGTHVQPWEGPLAPLRVLPPNTPLFSEEARKQHQHGPGGGLQLYAYDSAFTSANPVAPPLSHALKQAIQDGRAIASSSSNSSDAQPQCDFAVLVRMAWNEGPCSHVLVCRPDGHTHLTWMDRFAPPLTAIIATLAIALVSLFLAIGPVVRRIRKLTRDVRRAAEQQYSVPIEVQGADEVGALARAFNDAGKEIRARISSQETREKALRDFLENTTHDVMIPLTVLQGHLINLKERSAAGQMSDPIVLTSAMNETHYIASLLHNLSIAAKLEAADPAPGDNEVDLNALIVRVSARHLSLAKQQHVQLMHAVPEETVLVRGDVTLIEQAVSNVVYNAVKHHNRMHGHIAVTLARGRDGVTIIRVVDDGPGIEEADMAKLVERYARGNAARSRHPGGRGLGLNIAYRVSQLHHWDMRLSRSEFGGVQVEFIIPRVTPTGSTS